MDTRLGGLTKEIRVTRTAPRPRSSSTSRRRPWLSDLSPSRSREYSRKYTSGSLLHPCVLCINRSLWSAPGTRTDPGRPSRAAALARVDDRVVSVNEKAVVVSSVQGSGACVQRACDRAAPVTDSDGSPIKARTNQRIFSRCQCQPCSTRLIAAVELRRGGTRRDETTTRGTPPSHRAGREASKRVERSRRWVGSPRGCRGGLRYCSGTMKRCEQWRACLFLHRSSGHVGSHLSAAPEAVAGPRSLTLSRAAVHRPPLPRTDRLGRCAIQGFLP
jgi:hypothetical protein